MGDKAIPKDMIKKTMAEWIKGFRVVAPVREQSVLLFKEVMDPDEIDFTDEITYKSPKEFFFPQLEKMMSFNGQDQALNGQSIRQTIIFGAKPCDLEALKIINVIFTGGKFSDAYFINRMNNTILVGMGCVSEKPGCFCNERNINRMDSRDCDVFLKPEGNYYIVNILSEKGKTIFKDIKDVKDIKDIKDIETGITSENATKPDINRALEINASEKELFEKAGWDEISEKCIGCGTCTFVCPTCHCFEFKDTEDNGVACRYRYWDSCMYPRFTLHASGHNPRPTKKERFRQRVLHKYLYIKENFEYTACTGCGRCIRSCPAGMNIKSAIAKILEDLR